MEQQVKSIPTEEIEEFKKLVHKWLEFDDNIKKLKDAEKN